MAIRPTYDTGHPVSTEAFRRALQGVMHTFRGAYKPKLLPNNRYEKTLIAGPFQPLLRYHRENDEWSAEGAKFDPKTGRAWRYMVIGETPGDALRKLAELADQGGISFPKPDETEPAA